MLDNNRTYKGFTLIELLVVISIIAVLAAILFPVFARAREKARQSTCSSNQRQIAAAILMFAQDHEETLPTSSEVWSATKIDADVLMCPTLGKSTPNAYFYNGGGSESVPYHLSSKAIGTINDPTAAMMTCDGLYNVVPGNWGGAFGSNMMTGHQPSEVLDETRHSKGCIISYIDGHVAMANSAAVVENAFYSSGPTPPAAYTATNCSTLLWDDGTVISTVAGTNSQLGLLSGGVWPATGNYELKVVQNDHLEWTTSPTLTAGKNMYCWYYIPPGTNSNATLTFYLNPQSPNPSTGWKGVGLGPLGAQLRWGSTQVTKTLAQLPQGVWTLVTLNLLTDFNVSATCTTSKYCFALDGGTNGVTMAYIDGWIIN